MPRKKAKEKSDVKQEVKKELETKRVEPQEPRVKAATTTSMWNPVPDMGDVKPPEDSKALCECTHEKEMHYGPNKPWCNTPNCRCGEWKAL